MSHTPGPWAVIANAELPSRIHIIHVAGGDEGKANAHLIAAAPELLAACEACELAIAIRVGLGTARNLAQAAIANAKPGGE